MQDITFANPNESLLVMWAPRISYN